MSEDSQRASKLNSFAWGIIAFLCGSPFDAVVPFSGGIVAFCIYWFFLKRRGIHPVYFVLGYVFLVVVALVTIGSFLWWLIFWR